MPKIVVILEAGLVQDILSDEPVEAAVIDYDTEGADQEQLIKIPQLRVVGSTEMIFEDAFGSIREVDVAPERTRQLFEAVETA